MVVLGVAFQRHAHHQRSQPGCSISWWQAQDFSFIPPESFPGLLLKALASPTTSIAVHHSGSSGRNQGAPCDIGTMLSLEPRDGSPRVCTLYTSPPAFRGEAKALEPRKRTASYTDKDKSAAHVGSRTLDAERPEPGCFRVVSTWLTLNCPG